MSKSSFSDAAMLTKRIDGFDMSYRDIGSGEPVVLLHGSFSDMRFWSYQADAFTGRFRVIVPSLRPYWPSVVPMPEGGFDVPRYVHDVAAFIAAMDVGPVHLCGHSLGGHIALRVASENAGLVRTLVLAEPGGPLASDVVDMSRVPEARRVAEAMADAARLIEAGDTEAGLERLTVSATRPGGWQACPDFYREMARTNAHTLVAQAVEQRPPITRADIERLGQPVLLIGGADTVEPFPTVLNALAALIPQVSRTTIADGTHLMNIENPIAFNEAVLAFWNGHTALTQDAA